LGLRTGKASIRIPSPSAQETDFYRENDAVGLMVRRNFVAPSADLDRTPGFKRSPLFGEVNVRDGSWSFQNALREKVTTGCVGNAAIWGTSAVSAMSTQPRPLPDIGVAGYLFRASARRRNLRAPGHERRIRLMEEQFMHFAVRAEMELHPDARKCVDDEGSALIGTEFVG